MLPRAFLIQGLSPNPVRPVFHPAHGGLAMISTVELPKKRIEVLGHQIAYSEMGDGPPIVFQHVGSFSEKFPQGFDPYLFCCCCVELVLGNTVCSTFALVRFCPSSLRPKVADK